MIPLVQNDSSKVTRTMRVLIVEDEKALSKGLKFNFEQEGYEVDLAEDGQTALNIFSADPDKFDLVILDLMLPGMSGYDACREIRELAADIPILVLSARTLSEDKTAAFDAGSDQYMTKPFALPELLSRVRNLIERHPRESRGEPVAEPTPDVVSIGDVKVDFKAFEVHSGDQVHQLTTMEQQLLRYFISHSGTVLSRSQIMADVWGEAADITTRSIDNFVLRLRKMIEPNPAEPRHFLSVRGTGYRFVPDPSE